MKYSSAVRGLTAAALGCAALLSACRSDSSSPITSPIDARYALQRINGRQIPTTAAEGGGQRYVLLADTLDFSPTGSVARSVTYRHVSADMFPRDTIHRHHMVMPYSVDRGRLTMGWQVACPPNANCIGFEEGTITDGRAVVVGRLLWPGAPVLTFTRVRRG